MRFFVDECLSPAVAHDLAAAGYDAVCARDVGRLGERDDTVRERCLAENRIVVTHDIGDFPKLVGRVALHPGLVLLAEATRAGSIDQMRRSVAYAVVHGGGDPAAWTVNRVVEVPDDGCVDAEAFPPL